jgi:hypothetical protein
MVSCVEPFLQEFFELFVEQFEGARKYALVISPVPLLLVVGRAWVCGVFVWSVGRYYPGEVAVPALDSHPSPAS